MLQNVENVRLRTLLKRDDVMCYYKTYDWATHFLALVKGES